jgi:hypothetical protein
MIVFNMAETETIRLVAENNDTALLSLHDNDAVLLTKEENEVLLTIENVKIINNNAEVYEGKYEFTPTNELQTININGKQAKKDITINPIPSNYGLITYNGSEITVS